MCRFFHFSSATECPNCYFPIFLGRYHPVTAGFVFSADVGTGEQVPTSTGALFSMAFGGMDEDPGDFPSSWIDDQFSNPSTVWGSLAFSEEDEQSSAVDFVATCAVVEMEADTTCPICLNEMVEGIRLDRCKHVFHKNCISEWLTTKFTCPMCRAAVT